MLGWYSDVYPNESITAGERNPRLAITTDNTKRCRMHPVYMDLQITEMNVRNNLRTNTGIVCKL